MTDTNDRRVTELEQENADLRAEVERLRIEPSDVEQLLGIDPNDPLSKMARDVIASRKRADAAEAERDRLAAQIEAVRGVRARVLDPAQMVTEGPMLSRLKVAGMLDSALDADGGRDDTTDGGQR